MIDDWLTMAVVYNIARTSFRIYLSHSLQYIVRNTYRLLHDRSNRMCILIINMIDTNIYIIYCVSNTFLHTASTIESQCSIHSSVSNLSKLIKSFNTRKVYRDSFVHCTVFTLHWLCIPIALCTVRVYGRCTHSKFTHFTVMPLHDNIYIFSTTITHLPIIKSYISCIKILT